MDFATWDLGAFEKLSGNARKDEAARVDAICRESGFLLLRGHGIPETVISDVWAAAENFFALDVSVKQSVAAPYPGYPYGYLGPDREALAKSRGEETPPDLKESFNGGPLRVPDGISDPDAHAFCYQPTLWPDQAGFRDAWVTYYGCMERLAARVMAGFAEALGLDSRYFDPFIANPISALRALHYPAMRGVALEKQQRAGAHTDYGSLTILLPQPGSRGLQVQSGGSWVDVPAEDGAFVINIGDLMARWTADRWVSTLHRVVAIPNQPARQSLAFFHQPDWEAQIAPLDGSDAYPPVRSGPYLMDKFRSANA